MNEGTFWLPPQASTVAPEIDGAFNFINLASLIMLVIVTVGLIYFAWKYRRRSHADRTVRVEESKALELAWIVIPTLLVFVVFFWGFKAFIGTSIAPPNAYEIRAEGKKWLWNFTYPDGTQSTGDLVVPVGTPVKLIMTSTDVLHSFYVPAFRIKHDVIPNRYTTVWFEAVAEGEYTVFCTEYCGTGHSAMLAKVIVKNLGGFREWLATGGGAGGLTGAALGESLYTKQACNTCHSVDGSPGVGPSWLGTWGEQRPFTDGTSAVMDEAYVMESIYEPMAVVVEGYPGVMPAYPGLTEDQVAGLVAYMKQINGIETAALPSDSTAVTADGPAAPADSAATE
jgi:cytochrome c oxidase subunit 2